MYRSEPHVALSCCEIYRQTAKLLTKKNSIQLTKKETKRAKKWQCKAKEIVESNIVVVFSKTYCPFCKKVKELLTSLRATFKAIELDQESDGSEVQSALAEWTGQRTVPNVFIGGKHIGGCDAIMDMHKGGKLVPLLNDVGVIATSSL